MSVAAILVTRLRAQSRRQAPSPLFPAVPRCWQNFQLCATYIRIRNWASANWVCLGRLHTEHIIRQFRSYNITIASISEYLTMWADIFGGVTMKICFRTNCSLVGCTQCRIREHTVN
jgi:hypothetical protein